MKMRLSSGNGMHEMAKPQSKCNANLPATEVCSSAVVIGLWELEACIRKVFLLLNFFCSTYRLDSGLICMY